MVLGGTECPKVVFCPSKWKGVYLHGERKEIGTQLIVNILRGLEMMVLCRYAECVISSIWMKDIVKGLQAQGHMIDIGIQMGDNSSWKTLLLLTDGLGTFHTGCRLMDHIVKVSCHWHRVPTAVHWCQSQLGWCTMLWLILRMKDMVPIYSLNKPICNLLRMYSE